MGSWVAGPSGWPLSGGASDPWRAGVVRITRIRTSPRTALRVESNAHVNRGVRARARCWQMLTAISLPYCADRLSAGRIAVEVGVSKATVTRHLNKTLAPARRSDATSEH